MLDTTETRAATDPELDGEDPHLSDSELAELFADLDQLDAEKRGAWCVNSLEDADFALRRLGELQTEISENLRVEQANIDRIKLRTEALNKRCQRGVDYFAGKLREYVEAHRAELFKGKKKSRALLHGHIGTRLVGSGLKVVDAAKLLEWCAKQPVELEVLRVIQEPALAAIKEHSKHTGEIPDGMTLSAGEDEFYAKPINLGSDNGDD